MQYGQFLTLFLLYLSIVGLQMLFQSKQISFQIFTSDRPISEQRKFIGKDWSKLFV